MFNLKQPIITINRISYSYPDGTLALKDINLNIYKGEIIGIMGRNGAGKTTLVRMFNGLIRPTEGTIFYDGKDISNHTVAQLSKEIGVVFQNPQHQLFSSSVKTEIEFSLKNLNLNNKDINKIVADVLIEFDLEKYGSRSPLNLSGGETKKLSLATILCREPKVIVFDEPMLGQDAKEIKFFLETIKKLKQKKVTIVIITHNVDFALMHIPRIVLLSEGRILADGPSGKILSNKSLIEKGSLILPQMIQFTEELKKLGIIASMEKLNYSEIKNLIVDYLQNKEKLR